MHHNEQGQITNKVHMTVTTVPVPLPTIQIEAKWISDPCTALGLLLKGVSTVLEAMLSRVDAFYK